VGPREGIGGKRELSEVFLDSEFRHTHVVRETHPPDLYLYEGMVNKINVSARSIIMRCGYVAAAHEKMAYITRGAIHYELTFVSMANGISLNSYPRHYAI